MLNIKDVKKEFGGIRHSTLLEQITRRIHGPYDTLVHPCRAEKSLLVKYIPDTMNVDELLTHVTQKQKDLARRFNISKFPSDRKPGFLGQAAMFETFRESGEDFSFYFNGIYERGDASWLDGFGLLDTLIGFTYLRQYFGFEEVDIVQRIFESIAPSEVILTFEKNWMYRVITNISALIPRVVENHYTREVMKNLVKIQDAMGPTVSRVAKWTGLSRQRATRIRDIVTVTGLVHSQSLVPKNTGIVLKLTRSQSIQKKTGAEDLLCTSLKENSDCFISITYHFRDAIDGEALEFEAYAHNIDNYDAQTGLWTIRKNSSKARSVSDIYPLFSNSDITLPDNEAAPTDRDILFIALLKSMAIEHKPHWKREMLQWLVNGYGIPQKIAEKGLRNVFRKHMIRHQYSFVLCNDRHNLLALFEDSSKNTIPFIAEILSAAPTVVLRANNPMTYGCLYIYYPPYLSQDLHNLVISAISETGVNAEVFEIKASKYAETADLLDLIPE